MQEPSYTRRSQLQFAFNLLSEQPNFDHSALPEVAQLANEDAIRQRGDEIHINENYRPRYEIFLDQPISQGQYYQVETQLAEVITQAQGFTRNL
jgi:hypothetical protein